MKTSYLKAKKRAKETLKEIVRKVFKFQPGYEFVPAPSIQKQSLSFAFRGRTLTVESDYTTPLYGTIGEIVDFDCYQLSDVEFTGGKEGLVLDIGAHMGVAAVVLAQLTAGRVLCFEPFPRNCQFLQNNLKLNGLTNVQVTQAAVTEFDGTVAFEFDPTVSVVGHVAHTLKGDPLAFSQKLQVPSVTLRKALAPYPNSTVELIKLDCEGGEYAIVDQIGPDLAPRIKHLSFEVHDIDPQRNVTTLTERLKSLGYRVRYKKELHNRLGLHHLLASR
jgi:FkbM family methyltransferase